MRSLFVCDNKANSICVCLLACVCEKETFRFSPNPIRLRLYTRAVCKVMPNMNIHMYDYSDMTITQVLAAHSHVLILKKLIWSQHVFNQVGEWMCAWSSLLLGRSSVSWLFCTACVAGAPLQAAPFFTRWIYLILICFVSWGRKEEDIVQCFKLLENKMPGSAGGSARKWLWHPWQDQLPCSP